MLRIVVTTPLGARVVQFLREHGPQEGVFNLALRLNTSYSWLRSVLLDLERQGAIRIDRSTRPHTIILLEDLHERPRDVSALFVDSVHPG